MNELERVHRDGRGLPHLEAVEGTRRLEVPKYRPETIRALWMSSARVVAEERLGVRESGGDVF
jgi:hypothetical protein